MGDEKSPYTHYGKLNYVHYCTKALLKLSGMILNEPEKQSYWQTLYCVDASHQEQELVKKAG